MPPSSAQPSETHESSAARALRLALERSRQDAEAGRTVPVADVLRRMEAAERRASAAAARVRDGAADG